MLFRSSFVVLVVAAAVSASRVAITDHLVSLPFIKRINATGTFNIAKSDRARVDALKSRMAPTTSIFEADGAVLSAPATPEPMIGIYVTSVSVYSVSLVQSQRS